MALPKPSVTDRTLQLQSIVNTADTKEVLAWPKPNDEDYALFGRIIGIYSTIDFTLRYAAEIMDNNGMLEPPWKGKTAKLNMYKTTQAIRSSPIWNTGHNAAFDAIDEHRVFGILSRTSSCDGFPRKMRISS